MDSKIIVMLVVLILVGGSVGYAGAYMRYTSQINELTDEVSDLETQYETLSQQYETLSNRYNNLSGQYENLITLRDYLQSQAREHRKLLREELSPTRIIVDYGYGYRCWPFTSLRGQTVFTVATSVSGKHPVCKVFELTGFSEVEEIGDLYALDNRNTATGQPFITLDGSILVPVWNVEYYSAKTPWLAIYRYSSGAWTRVYEDTAGSYGIHIGQDPVTRAIYIGYHQPATFRSLVIKSTDDGTNWSVVYDVVEASEATAIIYSVAVRNDNIIATKRDKNRFIRSANGGRTWAETTLPTAPRTVSIFYDLDLSFITSNSYVYYSRDYFQTYKRIRIQSGSGGWITRYLIRVGGRLLLSALVDGNSIVLASRDLYHTATPVFSVEGGFAPRISGYGDYLLIGQEQYGTLTRIRLPKTLERGLACPILLWEDEIVPDNGETTDFIESQYNSKKTFFLYSDQSGTLYIQAYDEEQGTFRDIDSKSISANELEVYNAVETEARLMRLRFVPTAEATVSAWAVLV